MRLFRFRPIVSSNVLELESAKWTPRLLHTPLALPPRAPAVLAAIAPDLSPAASAHPSCAGRGESGTGGPLGPGPSMVPTCSVYSTPPLSSLPQPDDTPSAAVYPTHGPLPASMAGLAPQSLAHAEQRQFPTPGVAYDPYTPWHLAHPYEVGAGARDARSRATILSLSRSRDGSGDSHAVQCVSRRGRGEM